MGIVDPSFTMPGKDRPPQEFFRLKTQQGQINWLAQFLMSVNAVFDDVTGDVTTIAPDAQAYVTIVFDAEENKAEFHFFIPQGQQGEPGSLESVTAVAQTLAPGSSATVSVELDQETQSMAFTFGIPEGTPATDAQTYAAVGEWIEAHPEVVTTVQDGAVSVPKLAADVLALIDAKADQDGYYPQMSTGTADALMATEQQEQSWLQRVSTRDGAARIESLRGKTVVWNQLTAVTSASTTVNGITFTNNGDGSITVNGTATAQAVFNTSLRVESVADHKLLINGCPEGGSTSSYRLKNGYGISADLGSGLIETSTNVYVVSQIVISSGYTANNLKFIPQIFDLTRMFGAGNEPATVEEFEAMFPEDYYPYDAGSLLSVDISGISSAGVTREIPAATYFPTGLKSAGSVYDELTADKAITRIGAVDLGTLSWTAEAAWQQSRGLTRLWATVPNAETTNSENVIASGYFTTNLPVIASSMSTAYCIAMVNGRVYVTVPYPDIASRADFMTWLQTHPVTIYYADATPTETAINPPLNMSYKVEQGGTEHFVSTSTSSPQTATPRLAIVYGYTADGLIDEASSIIAPVESGSASTNYAIGGYFVMGGKLYKATRAIASGETITPGTNCTATNVMTEIVALTS